MCGIFGFASESKIPRLWQVTTQLAIYNENRGRQSWGLAYLDDKGVQVVKDVGEISRNLFNIPLLSNGILIGHTRAATVGDIKKENAHPFAFTAGEREVIGVHNGGLSNHAELNDKFQRNLSVDSMHIFAHIAEDRPMADLHGAGTIVWFQNKELNLCKFNGGALSVARLKAGGIVWSSEESALERALEGANLEYVMLKIEENKIYYFENNKLWDSSKKINISPRVVAQQQHSRRDNFYNNTRSSLQRVIRLQIVRSTTAQKEPAKQALTGIPEIDAIKKDIFNDLNISYSEKAHMPCILCGDLTQRRRTGRTTIPVIHRDKPMCLSCIAWEVYAEQTATQA